MIYAAIALVITLFCVFIICAAARRFIWDEPPAPPQAPWSQA